MRLNNVLGQLLLVGLAAAAVFSCSSGDDSTGGGSGSGGVSGSAGKGGSGGKGGSAGTSAGGSGGATSNGGSSGKGGKGGTEAGGAPGAAGSENGGAAGETPVASVACDECVTAAATSSADLSCTAGCFKATDGLTSDSDVAICESIADCLRQSDCVAAGAMDGTACYCGSLSVTDCFALATDPSAPNGACAQKIAAALPAGSPTLAVGMYYNDSTSPIGAAIGRSLCEQNHCPKECGLATGAAGAVGN